MKMLKAHEIESYWKAIDVIEAQDALLQLRIAVYPKLKETDQKRFYDFLYRKAYPNQKKKALKVEDFVKIAQGRGLYG